jgi:biopolymer transport protein ExbD
MLRQKKLEGATIPTASMADIAFLLLIFFLVATVIDVDTGIGLTLPEYTEEPPPPGSKDRMAAILINETGETLLDSKPIPVSQLKNTLKIRIKSKNDLPKNKKLIVSLKTDRKTKYKDYIAALDQVKLAFFDVRDEYSNMRFGNKYKDLDEAEQKLVKDVVPIIISIAEPERIE